MTTEEFDAKIHLFAKDLNAFSIFNVLEIGSPCEV